MANPVCRMDIDGVSSFYGGDQLENIDIKTFLALMGCALIPPHHHARLYGDLRIGVVGNDAGGEVAEWPVAGAGGAVAVGVGVGVEGLL